MELINIIARQSIRIIKVDFLNSVLFANNQVAGQPNIRNQKEVQLMTVFVNVSNSMEEDLMNQ